MAAVTVREMREMEARAIANGISEESLLRMAGERLGHALGRYFPYAGTAVGFLGKGHNAGDTLVALKVLRDVYDWNIIVRPAFPVESCADLVRKVWGELGSGGLQPSGVDPVICGRGPLVLLDGLLGTGAGGPLRLPLVGLAREIRHLREEFGAIVVAVDIPTGVDADTGMIHPGAIMADVTFMISNPKIGLLKGHASRAVGALAMVPVPCLAAPHEYDGMEMICPQSMDFHKMPREYDGHKGTAGRVWLLVGSERYAGAAALAAIGALHGGAGLVTVFADSQALPGIRAMSPPEVIFRKIGSLGDLPPSACDALVVGCGLGEINANECRDLLSWVLNFSGPAVVDADALNALAQHGGLEALESRHLVTPHPGEFRRLVPSFADLPREDAAKAFARRFRATLLLKGSRTLVAQGDNPLWCNSTGGPCMACGGQGDLLAGVIGALMAGGLPTREAAALGAWLCGRASEVALQSPLASPESITPSVSATCLGTAFNDWKSARR